VRAEASCIEHKWRDEGVIFEAMDPGRFLQESASVAEKTGFGPDSYFLVKKLTLF
jgi:hypothetical protein